MKRMLIIGALALVQNIMAAPTMSRSDWELVGSKTTLDTGGDPVDKAIFDSKDVLYYSVGASSIWSMTPLTAPSFNDTEIDISQTNINSIRGWNLINDTLWVGGEEGKISFRTPEGVWDSLPTRPAVSSVSGIGKANDGTLWIGTWAGPYTYKDEKWTSLGTNPKVADQFLFKKNGDVWAAGMWLMQWDGTKMIQHTGTSTKNLAVDKDDNIWVSAHNEPAYENADSLVFFKTTPKGYKSQFPYGLYLDSNDYIWLGGLNEVGIWDHDTNLIAYMDTLIPSINEDDIDFAHFLTDSKGDLWSFGQYITKYTGTAHHKVINNSSSIASSSADMGSSSGTIDAIHSGIIGLKLTENENSWNLLGLNQNSNVKIIFAGGLAQSINQKWEANQLIIKKPKMSGKAWLFVKSENNSQIIPVTLY